VGDGLDHDGSGGHDEPVPAAGEKTRAGLLSERDEANGIDWAADHRPWKRELVPPADLADAIVGICGGYLSGRAAAADNPDNYQVIIHAGTAALAAQPGPVLPGPPAPRVSAETPRTGASSGPGQTPSRVGDSPGPSASAVTASRVSAETPARNAMAAVALGAPLLAFPETHPAWPWRCHVEDGQVIDPVALRVIACDATISAILHDAVGNVINAGRRSRKPGAALRRAVRERDRHRCRFPGCESRRVDLHHIRFWAAETSLENLICLCKRHHALVHETGLIIATTPGGFDFYQKDGRLIPHAPPLPGGTADGLAAAHDAQIAYHTIVPPHSGGRLDLHEAIWVCFARAKKQQKLGLPGNAWLVETRQAQHRYWQRGEVTVADHPDVGFPGHAVVVQVPVGDDRLYADPLAVHERRR